jgi:hypothetical protein
MLTQLDQNFSSRPTRCENTCLRIGVKPQTRSTLPAASYDYLPPPATACCQPLVPRCACLEKDLRYLALDCFYGVVTARKDTMNA